MEHISEWSERIFDWLDENSDWDDYELNIWRFEYSVACLYNHYYGKLEDKKLYDAYTGLVRLIGGAYVLDSVIVYLEIMKTGKNSKFEFIDQFENNREQYEDVYEDFPDIIDEEFFKDSFESLQSAVLLETDGDELKVKDMFMLDISYLVSKGKNINKKMVSYFE